MPAGLTVTNDTHDVQITEDYRNLFLRYKFDGAVVTQQTFLHIMPWNMEPYPWDETPDSPYNSGYVGYIDVAATSPLVSIYIKPGASANAANVQVIACKPLNATMWRVYLCYADRSLFELYIFDVMPPSSAGYGLQVFNAAGELVYDSSMKPMRVAAVSRFEQDGRKFTYIPFGWGFYQQNWEETTTDDRDGVSVHIQCITRRPDGTVGEGTLPLMYLEAEYLDDLWFGPYQTSGGLFLDVTGF